MMNLRAEGKVVVASNFARMMNDPRYTSAGSMVREGLDEGYKNWVFELADVRETGAPFLGLLMTLTRTIRAGGGEVVLARVSRSLEEALRAMQIEEHWDRFASVEEACRSFGGDEAG